VLSLRSSFTAEWASDQIGEVENFEYVTSFGTSTDAQGNVSVSRNTTKNIEQRRAILPAEFMSFASSSNGNVFGLHSIPKLEGIVPRVCTFPLHRHRQTDDFSPRTGIDEMLLQPWWPEDYRRLGLPPPAPSPVIQVSKDSNVETKSALERVGRVFMDKRSEG
jgi:hypothetical protein